VPIGAIALAVAAVAAVWFVSGPGRFEWANPHASVPVPFTSPYANTRPGVAYVGDEACATCHAEITDSFKRHPMGRSMTTPEAVMPEAEGHVFEADGLAYVIERRDGEVVHKEVPFDPGAPGPAGVTAEAVVKYVIGSGTRGYAFLVERDHRLYQSPIAWYTQEEQWDLAPRYREHNLHFGREITPGCLFCHTNRFDTAEGKSTVFHGLAIGCERCHGPGELHVREATAVQGKDRTIVNPADLRPLALRENVCEQCHLLGSDRIERSSQAELAYRPGLPLEDFLLITTSQYDPERRRAAVGHVEQMRMSGCYHGSRGELGCVSCHDPHRLPEPSEKVAYYRGRCLECHASRGCSLPLETRLARDTQNACASCHMPPATLSGIAHTALTDHRIPRGTDRPAPATADLGPRPTPH
jgi:hypothetical protein